MDWYEFRDLETKYLSGKAICIIGADSIELLGIARWIVGASANEFNIKLGNSNDSSIFCIV